MTRHALPITGNHTGEGSDAYRRVQSLLRIKSVQQFDDISGNECVSDTDRANKGQLDGIAAVIVAVDEHHGAGLPQLGDDLPSA